MISILTLDEALAMEETMKRKRVAKTRRPRFVYVERLDEFKPPSNALEIYNDLARRYADRKQCTRYALDGSHYDIYYPMKLFRDGKAIALMREIAEQSKDGKQIIFVRESERPDCDIIFNAITQRLGNKVW